MRNNLLDAALKYSEAGRSIIPCKKVSKAPAIKQWKPYQSEIADPDTLKKWFSSPGEDRCLAVICGEVSGSLEVLDFDCRGELIKSFSQQIEEKAPGLLSRLALTQTQSDGFHIPFCCPETETPGNQKLAQRGIKVSGPGPHPYRGKKFTARQYGDDFYIVVDLIETRGEGGYFLATPSPGYKMLSGHLYEPCIVTSDERKTLIDTALSLNEWVEPHEIQAGYKASNNGPMLPGQDYDERGNFEAILEKHGWQKLSRNGQTNDGTLTEYWRRPGKNQGHSASIINGKTFYCFSSSGQPFERFTGYSPFAVYALLEHGGDFSQAARALAKEGYGKQNEKGEEPKKKGATLLGIDQLEKLFNEKINWLYRNIIPEALPIIINGREGEGKTTILLKMADEILSAHPEGIILWIASEGFVEDTKDKMQKLGVSNRLKIVQHPNGTYQFRFTIQGDLQTIDRLLNETRKTTRVLAVFIDSIRGITPYDDNDSRIKNPMMDLNGIVCDKHRASLIYIHHFKKGKDCSLLDRNTGPTSIASSVRAVFSVLPVSANVKKLVLAKANILVTFKSVRMGNNS